MAKYIFQQGSNILSVGSNIFETTDELPKPNLELDAAKLVGFVQGSPVGLFPDTSGEGCHGIQQVAANQPTYLANDINGNPAILFDGVNDFLALPYRLGFRTTFIVARWLTTNNMSTFFGDTGDINGWAALGGFWTRPSGDVPNTVGHLSITNPQYNKFYVNGGETALSAGNLTKSTSYSIVCMDLGDVYTRAATHIGIRADLNVTTPCIHLALAYVACYFTRLNFAARQGVSNVLKQRFGL